MSIEGGVIIPKTPVPRTPETHGSTDRDPDGGGAGSPGSRRKRRFPKRKPDPEGEEAPAEDERDKGRNIDIRAAVLRIETRA